MYLENINSPEDVKRLSIENLNILANEIRHALLTKLSAHGGHIGPNLGMVEATIAYTTCSTRQWTKSCMTCRIKVMPTRC